MLITSKEDFISSINFVNEISYEEFLIRCIIMYKNPISLIDYYKKFLHNKNDIRIEKFEQITKLFYNILITNKILTNEKFYNSYLIIKPLKKNYWSQYPICNDNIIICQKNDSSKRFIRNIHYADLLENTNITTSLPNKPTFLKSWKQMFEKLEIDDRYFTPSVLSQLLNNEPIHYFFQQYQPKASILNPYVIYYLLEYYYPQFCPKSDCTLFTPVLSWSVYAYAFSQSNFWNNYIGCDVMENVCNKTQELLQTNCINKPNKKYQIYCHQSEKLYELNINKVDCILICPPYYNMEIYETTINNNNQSTSLYQTYDEWYQNYWCKTLENCYSILKTNGIFGLIIGNYTEYKTKKYYNLIDNLQKSFDPNKWQLLSSFKLYNRLSPLRNNEKNRYEMLLNFKKIN